MEHEDQNEFHYQNDGVSIGHVGFTRASSGHVGFTREALPFLVYCHLMSYPFPFLQAGEGPAAPASSRASVASLGASAKVGDKIG